MKLLGVSQRIAVNKDTGEKRDCLAHDWGRFLHAAGIAWIALPNSPELALELASTLNLQGLLLTGGDDMGVFPERDDTERALLKWFMDNNRPALGVCRGFQVIHTCLGGELAPVAPQTHRTQRHSIILSDKSRRMVNSFHNFAPEKTDNPEFPLKQLALCELDQSLEAAGNESLLGIMWHPEREVQPDQLDIQMFRTFFKDCL